jgi:hypothetical protein
VLTQVLGRTISFEPITFERQKQAMITAGLPEAIAEDNATAVALMADGDLDYTTTCPQSSAARRAPSNSSPPTTPQRSQEPNHRETKREP